jgi:hypothetical protein
MMDYWSAGVMELKNSEFVTLSWQDSITLKIHSFNLKKTISTSIV